MANFPFADFDVQADLWTQAEFQKRSVDPPGNSDLLRAQHRSLLFDEPEPSHKGDSPEVQPRYKLIRGRPVMIANENTRPGGHTYETRRAIREVSGLGFSNELIVSSLTSLAHSKAPAPQTREVKMPDLSFAPRRPQQAAKQKLTESQLMEDAGTSNGHGLPSERGRPKM